MSIGKYLTNFGVITALTGALSTIRQTQQMPKDWRRYLVWLAWVVSLLLAIGHAAKQADDEAHVAASKEAQRNAKAIAKLEKKRLKD